MQIIIFLLVGLLTGTLARFLFPGKEPGGWIVSIAIGIAGSMLGGFFGQLVGIYREGEPAGLGMSLLGAMVVVAIHHAVARRRSLA
jgi:uncharacterized membrane protein YeaQ/YmgE (transglycosylase-associated protein family)